jgi:hypothetical protein
MMPRRIAAVDGCEASVKRMTRPGAEALAAERRKDAPATSALYHLKPQETLCTGLGSDYQSTKGNGLVSDYTALSIAAIVTRAGTIA